jgi:hypothetical protein
MQETKFKYDVAFSLLAQDEGLASEINDLLSDRYQTFLYSGRQKEIAGTDGEIKFKTVFAEEARFIVVLYRDGWGTTPWTRMEEEAIRGRAFDEGYDFVKFIPLDEKQTVPKYLPRTQLWINALRFGAKSAASIIEARLSELGVQTREENAVDRAARLHRSMVFEGKRKAFANSIEGVNLSNTSFNEIERFLHAKIGEIETAGISLKFEIKRHQRTVIVLGLKKCLNVQWHYSYANSLEGAHLDIELWDGHPPFPGVYYAWDNPRKLRTHKFTFQLLQSDVGAWVNQSGDGSYDAAGIADFALHFYMDNGAE